jgi:DnaJ-domain-containing protein 1
MQNLLIILALALLGLVGLRWFLRANPATVARNLRRIAGGAIMALAAVLLARGQVHAAFMLAAAGLALLAHPGLFGVARKSPGQSSQVRTATLEMRLEHDSGAMQGRVVAGAYAGRELDELTLGDLLALLADCHVRDAQSAALLESYLDRAHPDWREAAAAGGAGSAEGMRQGTAPARAGAMSVAEALALLGLEAGASEDQIRAAWRELMKRNHPDQGGSAYLAAQINEAKDVLLGKRA